MKFEQLQAFRKHVEGASPDHLCSCYFVIAKDAFLRNMALEILIRSLLDEKASLPVRDAEKFDLRDLAESLASPSFFGGNTLLHLRNADKLKKEEAEALLPLLQKIPPRSYLLLSGEVAPKNSRFMREVEKNGVICDLVEPKPWEKEKALAGWIAQLVAKERKRIDSSLCTLLVQRLGTDLALLKNEVEKLICYLGDRERILQEDVEAVCSETPQASIWKAGDALFAGSTAEALVQGRILLEQGNALILLLKQLRSSFATRSTMAGLLSQGASEAEIAGEFPHLRGALFQRNMAQAREIGLERALQALIAIDEAELSAKEAGNDQPGLLWDRLVLRLQDLVVLQ